MLGMSGLSWSWRRGDQPRGTWGRGSEPWGTWALGKRQSAEVRWDDSWALKNPAFPTERPGLRSHCLHGHRMRQECLRLGLRPAGLDLLVDVAAPHSVRVGAACAKRPPT